MPPTAIHLLLQNVTYVHAVLQILYQAQLANTSSLLVILWTHACKHANTHNISILIVHIDASKHL